MDKDVKNTNPRHCPVVVILMHSDAIDTAKLTYELYSSRFFGKARNDRKVLLDRLTVATTIVM
jgi:hypothetical protein